MREWFTGWKRQTQEETDKVTAYERLSQSTHLKIHTLLGRLYNFSGLGQKRIIEFSRRRDNIVRIHFANRKENIKNRLRSLENEILMLEELARNIESFKPEKYTEESEIETHS